MRIEKMYCDCCGDEIFEGDNMHNTIVMTLTDLGFKDDNSVGANVLTYRDIKETMHICGNCSIEPFVDTFNAKMKKAWAETFPARYQRK